MQIEMEASERNYLYRLLEKYENYIKENPVNGINSEYNLTMIKALQSRLLGKKLEKFVSNSKSPINYYTGE